MTKKAWTTPRHILDRIGPIALDPCTEPNNPTKAAKFYTEKDNALQLTWDWDGLLFMNPPYERPMLYNFMRHAWHQYLNRTNGKASMVWLIPAKTDTKYWHEFVMLSDAIVFIKGRLRFGGAKGPGKFPSVLVYFGEYPGLFLQQFSNCDLSTRVPTVGWIQNDQHN